ncbi:Gldg family protein [Romeria aff. gracilis LEGE 07310]|uniref:Gldg family protein n=1 Tax=Vasconcelosia minhoensis LEGE 07310 TaxID=915328 RepID=A0A8J7DBD8_9CYAN|nr:Gldg family protein [Romeria gracilis]MBE9076268.1 Gldg family protein [Romeria aff. gracilis LEGE 07310]
MNFKRYQGYLTYFVWPGITLTTAGLVAGLLANWTVLSVTLFWLGLAMIAVSLAASLTWGKHFLEGFWQRRSTQASTNATLSVLSVLVILGLTNFLGAQYDTRIDLTEGQLFTLAPASRTVLEALDSPARVVIFDPRPNPADQQLLNSYRRVNPDLIYEYVDPIARPRLAQEFGLQAPGEVYVQAGERQLLVQRVSPEEPLSERLLTNKLSQLAQTELPKAYMLQGHGEYRIDGTEAGLSEAVTRLEEENYQVEPLNLADTENNIPQDAAILVLARPQQALFDSEVNAIRRYLETGGSLMALIDPNVETGLDALFADWGIELADQVVIDTSGGGQLVGLGPAAPLVTTYGDHPITQALDNGRSFYPLARPLRMQPVEGVSQTPLLLTAPQSHAQPISETGELEADDSPSPEGPFILGVALSRAAEAPNEAPNAESAPESSELNPSEARPEARLVIIGNSSFAADGYFNRQLNGDVFLNAMGWLSKTDRQTLSIRPKQATDRRIVMTVEQQILLTVLVLVVLPLAGLSAAGATWARRR